MVWIGFVARSLSCELLSLHYIDNVAPKKAESFSTVVVDLNLPRKTGCGNL